MAAAEEVGLGGAKLQAWFELVQHDGKDWGTQREVEAGSWGAKCCWVVSCTTLGV